MNPFWAYMIGFVLGAIVVGILDTLAHRNLINENGKLREEIERLQRRIQLIGDRSQDREP